MPNRYIKESICTSESLSQLTDFEENLFYKLIVNCDDYGRFDGRPSIIKARCYPLRDRLTLKSIEEAISSLARVGCVELYEVDSKPYLHFPAWRFHQQIRATKSKYPAPNRPCNQLISDDINGNQPPANVPDNEYEYEYDIIGENSPEFSADTDISGETTGENPGKPGIIEIDGDEVFEKAYKFYPRKEGKADGKRHYVQYLTNGKEKKGQSKLRYNHVQIGTAIKYFADSMKDRETEYVKEFSSFMDGKVIDYVEKSAALYQSFMEKRYGAGWQKIRFKYRFKGVGSK